LATLDNVSVNIAVVLGTTSMPIHQVLRLGRGAVIELDASEEDEVRILANNLPVAKGTVIVSGNKIAVEVKELLPRSPEATGDLALHRPFSAHPPGRPCPAITDLLHPRRRADRARVPPTCGRGGIGRRTSLRC
jgi:flagellar motor switch protein FliN/FliY